MLNRKPVLQPGVASLKVMTVSDAVRGLTKDTINLDYGIP